MQTNYITELLYLKGVKVKEIIKKEKLSKFILVQKQKNKLVHAEAIRQNTFMIIENKI